MKRRWVRSILVLVLCLISSTALTGCFNGGGLGDGGGFLGLGLLGPGNAFGDVGPGGPGRF